MNFGNNGLWGILVLIADIWAIINIAQSSASNGKKVLWIVLVLLLPVVGVIVWF
ncbi:MAG: PLDc N-terminal domain-containing protein, partial [Betaproteobacteria bacterium]